jgi:hypothetical protein
MQKRGAKRVLAKDRSWHYSFVSFGLRQMDILRATCGAKDAGAIPPDGSPSAAGRSLLDRAEPNQPR